MSSLITVAVSLEVRLVLLAAIRSTPFMVHGSVVPLGDPGRVGRFQLPWVTRSPKCVLPRNKIRRAVTQPHTAGTEAERCSWHDWIGHECALTRVKACLDVARLG